MYKVSNIDELQFRIKVKGLKVYLTHIVLIIFYIIIVIF